MISELPNGIVRADGRSEIVAIEAFFGVTFPDDRDYETLAGFLLSEIGRVPVTGDEHRWRTMSFRVAEADDTRIISVEIEIVEASEVLDEIAS